MLGLNIIKNGQIRVISRTYCKSETSGPSSAFETSSPEQSSSELVFYFLVLVNAVFGYIISVCLLQNTISGPIISRIDSPSDGSLIEICDSRIEI